MLPQLQPFLYQRARRLLPVTVKSDSGLADGEIWFIDGCEITFWCRERLESASRYEMRADVKTIGRNVDLMVEIVDVMHGRDAGAPGGYLHRGEFMALETDDERRLTTRFWQLNPQHAPADMDLEAHSGTHPGQSPTPKQATPPRVRSTRSSSSVRSRGPQEQARRRPTPGERRRLREHGRAAGGVPDPPLAREQRVVVDVAPGAPPSAMIAYSHREVMQADVLLRGEDIWFFVACHPLLWEGQELALYVQLPAGNVVQLRCVVVAVRGDHCVVGSKRLHASLLANLKAALGV